MEKLIEKAKKGDKEAFTELIYGIRHDLYKIARCRLACEDDIEDAIQETIIKTFKYIKRLNKNASFKAWIITILINNCNTIYKKNKDRNISFESLELERTYQKMEEYKGLDDLDFYLTLKDLNYDERIVLILFYLEDYSIKDMSKLLKTNENTIKTRLKRGKDKIKNKYMKGNEEYGFDRYKN